MQTTRRLISQRPEDVVEAIIVTALATRQPIERAFAAGVYDSLEQGAFVLE